LVQGSIAENSLTIALRRYSSIPDEQLKVGVRINAAGDVPGRWVIRDLSGYDEDYIQSRNNTAIDLEDSVPGFFRQWRGHLIRQQSLKWWAPYHRGHNVLELIFDEC
jgi:hypothetical protein